MEFLYDLWSILKVRKKFWLLPILITLLVVLILILLSRGNSPTPFSYTHF